MTTSGDVSSSLRGSTSSLVLQDNCTKGLIISLILNLFFMYLVQKYFKKCTMHQFTQKVQIRSKFVPEIELFSSIENRILILKFIDKCMTENVSHKSNVAILQKGFRIIIFLQLAILVFSL